MRSIDLLKGCSLFADLPSKALADLARIAMVRRVDRDDILFHDGDEAKALFVVASGSVDLIKASPDGREQLVRGVKRGGMFAEAAMFSGEAYPVTAIVRTATELLVIEKAKLKRFLAAHPEAAMAIIGVMAKLLRHLNNLLAELSLGTVAQRIAAYLLRRASNEGKHFELGIAKRELAFRLGTTPETLSRHLRQLSRSGTIDMRGRAFCIKDIKALHRFGAE